MSYVLSVYVLYPRGQKWKKKLMLKKLRDSVTLTEIQFGEHWYLKQTNSDFAQD